MSTIDLTDARRPLLTSGSAGLDVHLLGVALGLVGHENSISRGEQLDVLDETVLSAVYAFRASEGVKEEDLAPTFVGPATWDALIAKVEKTGRKRGSDGRFTS